MPKIDFLNKQFNELYADHINLCIEVRELREVLFKQRDRNLFIKLGRTWKKFSTRLIRTYYNIRWIILYKREFERKCLKESQKEQN